MPDGGHTGSEVDVFSDMVFFGHQRRPRMQPDPHPDPSVRELLRQRRGRRQRPRGSRESEEEGVALGVDLYAALTSAGLADQPAVLGEGFGVGLRAELVEQPRRTSTSVKRKVTVPVGRSGTSQDYDANLTTGSAS